MNGRLSFTLLMAASGLVLAASGLSAAPQAPGAGAATSPPSSPSSVAVQAMAGDARTALMVGTLQLPRPPELELRALDITVTPQEVRGRYVLFNRANRDVALGASFAAPDLDAAAPGFGYTAIPQPEQINFMGFAATVDGVPVALMDERHVFGAGLERTQLLEDAGAPPQPAGVATWEALGKLSPQALQDLRAAGLIDMDRLGERLEPRPRWLLKTAWHWPQVFPAGKETVITWRHAASVSVGTTPLAERSQLAHAARYARHCAGEAINSAANAARNNGPGNDWLLEREQRLRISTGPASAGSAGVVTLTIDTGADDVIVAACISGLERAGPGRWRMRRENAVLDEDLHVLFISPGKVASQGAPPPDDADAAPAPQEP